MAKISFLHLHNENDNQDPSDGLTNWLRGAAKKKKKVQ